MATAQPVRKYDDKGAPPFKVLKDGENPPLDAYDNFVIGPTYAPAPERKAVDGVPQGKVRQFAIDSKETKLFNPGIARKEFGKVDPTNPKTLIVETHPIDYKRAITVYVPAQYQAGTEAPFMVVHDGPAGARGIGGHGDDFGHVARREDQAECPFRTGFEMEGGDAGLPEPGQRRPDGVVAGLQQGHRRQAAVRCRGSALDAGGPVNDRQRHARQRRARAVGHLDQQRRRQRLRAGRRRPRQTESKKGRDARHLDIIVGAVLLERFEDKGLSHYSYAVGCEGAGEIAIVDPRRDIDVYLEFAHARSLRIVAVLETHIHADFASGSVALAEATGADVWASAYDDGELYETAFAHRPTREGDATDAGQDAHRGAAHAGAHTGASVVSGLRPRPRAEGAAGDAVRRLPLRRVARTSRSHRRGGEARAGGQAVRERAREAGAAARRSSRCTPRMAPGRCAARA